MLLDKFKMYYEKHGYGFDEDDQKIVAIDHTEEMLKSFVIGASGEIKDSKMREWLWINHGCRYLYVDDGEKQCNRCLIDFKRDDWTQIAKKILR
jgi:hypothetical protein